MSIATQLRSAGILSGGTPPRPATFASFTQIADYTESLVVIDGDLMFDRTLTENRYRLDLTSPIGSPQDSLQSIENPANMSVDYTGTQYETRTTNPGVNTGGGTFTFRWFFRGEEDLTLGTTVSYSDTNYRPVSGTTGDIMTKAVDDNIAGLTGTEAEKELFSTLDHATPSYVRGASNWLAQAGLYPTPYSAGNDTAASRAVSLIAPNIGVTANHFPAGVGYVVYFVAADNTLHSGTITATTRIGSTDIRLVKFDTEFPSSIGFFKVFPKNYADTFKAFETIRVPVILGDQERKSLVSDISTIDSDFWHQTPTDAQRLLFNETIISGDSADPVFTNLNGDWVLFTTHFTVGYGPFLSLTANYDAINVWMAANSAYQLTDVTL